MAGIFSLVSASIRKTFKDNFSNRSDTTGSLGAASDGSKWNPISKVISVQNGKAKSGYVPQPSDPGGEYPIATVDMPTQNNIITLQDTNVGSAVALWVQTSADWWMVSVDSSYNFIPGTTNYASGPQTFTGSSAFTSAQAYSVVAGNYSSAILYSQGPVNYSIVAPNYTSGTPNYSISAPLYSTVAGQSWTSSGGFFSSQNFFSTPFYTPGPTNFTPGPWSNVLVGSGWTAAPPSFYSATANTTATTWARANSYTISQNFTGATNYIRPDLFWTGSPPTFTAGAFVRTGPNTYSRNFTSSRTFTSGGPTASVRNYTAGTATYNLTQFFTSNATTFSATNFTSAAQFQAYSTFVPDQSFSSSTQFTRADGFTAGPTNFTSSFFYTSSGPFFTSNQNYTSNTPFTSSQQFSSATNYTSNNTYSGVDAFSSTIVYSGGTTFTSGIAYSSSTTPDSFAYAAILKVSNSINDIVSEISSLVVSSIQTIKSIIVQTSENVITAKAFSDTGAISQLGNDLVYTATNAIINTRYGVSLSKAEYSNDEIASNVSIERG